MVEKQYKQLLKKHGTNGIKFVCPYIDEDIVDMFMYRSLEQNKKKKDRYTLITQIYTDDIHKLITSCNFFLQSVASNKLLWTRDVLKFFDLEKKIRHILLKFHEIEVEELEKQAKHPLKRGLSYLPKHPVFQNEEQDDDDSFRRMTSEEEDPEALSITKITSTLKRSHIL